MSDQQPTPEDFDPGATCPIHHCSMHLRKNVKTGQMQAACIFCDIEKAQKGENLDSTS